MTIPQLAVPTQKAGAAFEADPLTEVQLKVARRADEFARVQSSKSLLNLHCWLMAEAELFERDLGKGRNPGATDLTRAS